MHILVYVTDRTYPYMEKIYIALSVNISETNKDNLMRFSLFGFSQQ